MSGLSPAETEKRLPEIIAFSDLERFVVGEVRTYSTGMYARLAFAVASSVEPDIMVVDEALAVSDQHFQKKCIDRMMAVREQGDTLIFCSHALYFIRKTCDQCLWLRDGRIEMLSPAAEVIDEYQNYERSLDAETALDAKPVVPAEGRRIGGETHLREVTIGGDCHDGSIETEQTLQIRVVARVAPDARVEGVHVGIVILRVDMLRCYGASTEVNGAELHPRTDNEYGVKFVVEALPLLAGDYNL